MKFLLDTNILIPLEPAGEADLERQTGPAADFVRMVAEAGFQVFIHPEAFTDISRDADENRRSVRKILLGKYPSLRDAPPIPDVLTLEVGSAQIDSNDWVDNALIAAVYSDAVDYLVTEDNGIIRKARRVGLQDRIVTLSDAAMILDGLIDSTPPPPPAVQDVKAHSLRESDPIFIGLREDYPGFDAWLRKCKLEHRQAWTIAGETNMYAAICIVNSEDAPPDGLNGKVLKICTFKVSEKHGGMRHGELLLKTVFGYACSNSYDWVFLTTYPKQELLMGFLEDFGFTPHGDLTPSGEHVLVKPMSDLDNIRELSPLDYHVRYGPHLAQWSGPDSYIIPIQPPYHRMLFPEYEHQLQLIPGAYPCGNSIRKAYLCHSPCREISPGDNLLFYRSDDWHAVAVHAVAESTCVSCCAEEIARYVSKRTVYPFREIQALCLQDTLAILFRQSLLPKKRILLRELIEAGMLKAHPQSITKLPAWAIEWFVKKINQ